MDRSAGASRFNEPSASGTALSSGGFYFISMRLITKLKSLLGLDDQRSQPKTSDVGVTVEHEPEADESEETAAAPETSTESAVKGVDEQQTETTEEQPVSETTADDEAETETEAEDTEVPAEPAEPSEETADEADETPSESPENIKGIGASYAQKLADAGIDDIADLAEADADSLAEKTDLSAKRISRWIERAREY